MHASHTPALAIECFSKLDQRPQTIMGLVPQEFELDRKVEGQHGRGLRDYQRNSNSLKHFQHRYLPPTGRDIELWNRWQ